MLQQPIECRRRDRFVAKHVPSGAERLVGCDYYRAVLITHVHDTEEHVRLLAVERLVANLVDNG